MRTLKKGLIVSCYLDSMRGAEKEFISAVAHSPHIVALRIEGLDNIRYARQIAPERYIIGLVKVLIDGKTFITPISEMHNVISAGADMVASESPYPNTFIPRMRDLHCDVSLIYKFPEEDILSTTYFQKAFDLIPILKGKYKNRINLEGGIETSEEIQKGFDLGADFVTIGKAINDPPTIINNLMQGVDINGKV